MGSGHDKEACEKKKLGFPSTSYDSSLRCSPYQKYEQRPAFTPSPGQPRARRGMDFSLGSVGSATCQAARSAASTAYEQVHEIPESVDAHDGFEEQEKMGEAETDEKLASEVERIRLQLSHQQPECSKVQQMKVQFDARAVEKHGGDTTWPHKKKSAGGGKKVPAGRRHGTLVIRDNAPKPDDLIPAMRGLDSLEVSFDSVLDSMVYNDSILGKRHVDGLLGHVQAELGGKALVPFVEVPVGGI